MHFVLRHFWLVVLAVMLLNLAIWRPRLLALVAAGRATRDDVDGFVRGGVIACVAFALAGEIIVLAAGWPNPLCVYTEPRTSPGVLASWGLTLVAWALLLWWVWRGRGAGLLARLGPALMQGHVRSTAFTPRQVRLAVTTFLVLITVGVVIMMRMQQPAFSCHALPF